MKGCNNAQYVERSRLFIYELKKFRDVDLELKMMDGMVGTFVILPDSIDEFDNGRKFEN